MSLSVIEPTGVNLLRGLAIGAYEQLITSRDAYFRAFESGDKDAARQVIDLHDGDGSFDALPSRVRDYVMATMRFWFHARGWRSTLGASPFLASSFEGLVDTLT